MVRGEGKWGEWGRCEGVDKVRCGVDEENAIEREVLCDVLGVERVGGHEERHGVLL